MTSNKNGYPINRPFSTHADIRYYRTLKLQQRQIFCTAAL